MRNAPVPAPFPVVRYSNSAYGSWGEFGSPEANPNYVLYLSAHVQLDAGHDPDAIGLVESIAPVREVLDTKQLAFSELLQRDLEDHRVMSGLIPYLMEMGNPGDSRVSFFPPLLAVILPFDGERPSSFPDSQVDVKLDDAADIWQQVLEVPNYFKFARTSYDDSGSLVRTQRTAKLSWNPRNARLVVIDGQHRAMALLALYRTLAKDGRWEGRADRYKNFYIDEIRRRYKDQPLPKIEVPVTICVFPGLLGMSGRDVHAAARRLFVDVNKEAKTPNKSRLILLSESNLTHMFTRSLLDELRRMSQESAENQLLPISAIEFDTPGSGNAMNEQRAICITNIEKLSQIVNIVIRCKEYLVAVQETPKRMNIGKDDSLRSQLGLVGAGRPDQLFGPSGEHFKVTDIRENAFPAWAFEELRERFLSRHGRSLIRIFSQVMPYSLYRTALSDFERNWNVVVDEVQTLSKEALFDGVGTYWTLRDIFEEWREENKSLIEAVRREREASPPAAVEAWRIVKLKEDEFETTLADTVLRAAGAIPFAGDIELTQRLRKCAIGDGSVIDRAKTLAVQAGLAATFAGLQVDFRLDANKIESFTELFIGRLNDVLGSTSESGIKRLFIFAQDHPDSSRTGRFYLFSKSLEPIRFAHMRWIWLEIFFASAVTFNQQLVDLVGQGNLDRGRQELVRGARKKYVSTVVEEAISKLPREATQDQRDEVKRDYLSRLAEAYRNWFDEEISTESALQADVPSDFDEVDAADLDGPELD